MIKKIKNSKGYVSIEAIVISGLVIGVGVVAFMAFQSKANSTVNTSLNSIQKSENNAVVNKPW